MELVVTEVEGSVDGLEGFKGDVDLLFLSFIGQDGTTVDDETIGRDWEEGRGGCYLCESHRSSRVIRKTVRNTHPCCTASTSAASK